VRPPSQQQVSDGSHDKNDDSAADFQLQLLDRRQAPPCDEQVGVRKEEKSRDERIEWRQSMAEEDADNRGGERYLNQRLEQPDSEPLQPGATSRK
jgi:hypothetical protein